MAQRVALVTGGAKRVGRAIATRLAEAGFDLAVTYFHSGDQAAELVHELTAQGREVAAIPADLEDPIEAAEVIWRLFSRQFERLDVLVHNASVYVPDDPAEVDLKTTRRLFSVHVEAPLLLTRRFAPMLRDNRGHIVTMLDILAQRPWPHYQSYCASKAALWNLTLSWARELAPEVTVNGIAPGVVEWPEDFSPEQREAYLRRVPLGRAGAPADAANLVHYLVTEGAYLTGQVIRLDGGRSIT